ncbi:MULTISPECIES: hypothetical protein [Sphingomonas]|uniref:hypothetical protein n=1 Tax=Sphingomonas TaxID=13687 RepID=UPI000DEEBB4D|nr:MULTISPECIES: hypothetical protein [Sphingomonas]
MSLKSLLALADDKLEEIFNRKPHDPSKDRKRVTKMIDRTERQFASVDPVRGRKNFTVANNTVKFTPGFAVGGKSEHYVPSERFPEYLKHFRSAVEGGELDDAIGAGEAAPVKRRARRSKASA